MNIYNLFVTMVQELWTFFFFFPVPKTQQILFAQDFAITYSCAKEQFALRSYQIFLRTSNLKLVDRKASEKVKGYVNKSNI